MTKIVLDIIAKVKIIEYVQRTEIIKKDEEGYAVYKEGWNDEILANEVVKLEYATACSAHNIKSLREKFFGMLRKPKAGEDILLDELNKIREEMKEVKEDSTIIKSMVNGWDQRLAYLTEALTKQAAELREQKTINLKVTDFIYNKYKVRITK